MNEKKKFTAMGILILAVSLMFLAGCMNQPDSTTTTTGENGEQPKYKGKTLTLASPPWPGGTMKSHVMEEALESKLDIEVELKSLDGPVAFQAVENGDVDAFVEAWLPKYFHEKAVQLEDSYVNLGPNYHNAVVAYGIPTSIAEEHDIETLSDLEGKASLFDTDGNGKGEIYTIKPGSSYCQQSQKDINNVPAMSNFEAKCSSTAGMATELQNAVENDEPILITSWKPFWIHDRWNITHLKDDTGESSLTNFKEHIDMVVRNGFKEDFGPEMYNILDKVRFDGETTKMMFYKHEGMTAKQAAHKWVTENQDKIDAWFTEGADEHEWCKHIGNSDMQECPDNIGEMWENGEITLSE